MKNLTKFSRGQIEIVNESVAMAEDLVHDYYKMSTSQWLRLRYDIKTLANLAKDEIVFGRFAQVVRYERKPNDRRSGSYTYDFYKICLQDHTILNTLGKSPQIELLPFALYIITHELIHVVRFRKFLQNFDASDEETHAEEMRVHINTKEVLNRVRLPGLSQVVEFYDKLEGMKPGGPIA